MIRACILVLTLVLFSGSAFAAFIQSPIPPSSHENYLLDRDKDGRLDRLSIKFLGAVSEDYLEQMVDSLTFDWVDASGNLIHIRRLSRNMAIDSKVNRRVNVDLLEAQMAWQVQTGLSSDGDNPSSLGNVRLFLKGGSEYALPVRDRMSPVVRSAQLKRMSSDNARRDSLKVSFSESVSLKKGCSDIIEYKSSTSGDVYVLQASSAQWNQDSSAVVFVLNESSVNHLESRDSLKLLPGCVKDSAGNASSDSAYFVNVDGLFPLDYETGNMVVLDNFLEMEFDKPVFQLLFRDVESEYPNEREWGVAMDIFTPEFNNAVSDVLGLKENTELPLSKFRIQYSLRIYTSLGEFVATSSVEVRGDDSRFQNGAKRLFLKWNLMDGHRRYVATGTYIANIAVIVAYDGKVVYRSDVHHGPTTKIFGVKRR